jgi:hypothetical protein
MSSKSNAARRKAAKASRSPAPGAGAQSSSRSAVGAAASRSEPSRPKGSARQAAVRRRTRRRRFIIGVVAIVVAVVAIVVVAVSSSSNSPTYVLPPPVGTGSPTFEPPAYQTTNTSGIPGVVAYVTTGWPTSSDNGPKREALPHAHVTDRVIYSVTPPVGGDHNAAWMNCGNYPAQVPSERAVHNLEHGAVWITYQPSLPASEISQLQAFANRQTVIPGTGSRYMDVTPFDGMTSPIVISAWGNQLRVTSPSDPRLQRFVNHFRHNPRYTPEYGAPCTGGLGAPLPS